MVKNLPCNSGDASSIPQKATKILHAATKTQHSQIRKKKRAVRIDQLNQLAGGWEKKLKYIELMS